MLAGALPSETAQPSLSTDRITYLVGETPVYEIRNASPAQPLQWTIQREGKSSVAYADPAQRTDDSGAWSGNGGPWTHDLTGFYTITAQIGDSSARTNLNVVDTLPCLPGKTAVDCIGVVHVAGEYRFAGPGTPFGDVPFVVEGAQQILNLGARRGCFYLTPQYKTSDYPFDDFGVRPIEALVDLVASPPFAMLFDQPFEEFVLTTYTFANWGWVLDRAQGGTSVRFQPGAEVAEIADLVAFLARQYPDQQFTLKNWEGDWQLQGNFDPESAVDPDRLREFVAWMDARQLGVERGRAKGLPVRIQHAIEFNLLSRSVRDEPGILRDVARDADSDLIAYSSWETAERFDTRAMKDAIAFIQSAPASRGRSVIISEFGQPNSPADGDAQARLNALVSAFVDSGVKAFFWEIFNNGVPYGLIGPGFERFEAWFALRQALGGSNSASIVHDPEWTDIPARMRAGDSVFISATFLNTGPAWYKSVGYQLALLGPGEVDLGEVAWLPYDVPASAQVTFRFDFTAPSEAGFYSFRLAQRGIEVFGEAFAFEVFSVVGN